ncbi:hypothetical protein BD413DRAFT_186497 [Trametes elegans]|nr:hypothetical protein BD413DRAFT_186497 [Trametes elegans]
MSRAARAASRLTNLVGERYLTLPGIPPLASSGRCPRRTAAFSRRPLSRILYQTSSRDVHALGWSETERRRRALRNGSRNAWAQHEDLMRTTGPEPLAEVAQEIAPNVSRENGCPGASATRPAVDVALPWLIACLAGTRARRASFRGFSDTVTFRQLPRRH